MSTKIKIKKKNSEIEKVEDSNTGVNSNNVLIRPENNEKGPFQPGFYNGTIREAEIAEYEDYYNEDRDTHEVVVFSIEIWNENNNSLIVKKFDNLSFSPQSNLFESLSNLEQLPPPGEELKLSVLENLPVKLKISIRKDGKFNRVDEIYLDE